jgi:dTDP-glucose 4,6-dehydratase
MMVDLKSGPFNSINPMRILVTGGAGFIGSNLVHLLLERGHEVLNIDKLTYAGNLSSLGDAMGNPSHHFLQLDICDAPQMQTAFAEFQPDAVMHLAAESHVDRSIDAPDDFIRTNILGTYTLLQTSREHWSERGILKDVEPSGNRNRPVFLHVSTDEVYGSLGGSGSFTETTPYAPHSPYSASKASSDHLARAWHDTYDLPVIVTNCSNNYGPHQFPEKLIPVVILNALNRKTIPVYGAGDNVRDWLFVEDHVRALLTVVESGVIGETYNIGGNNELKNIDLVRSICAILDRIRPREDGTSYETQIRFVTDRPGHDLRYAVDASKIKRELDWSPTPDTLATMERTIRWYLDNEAWWSDILNGTYKLERLGTGSVNSPRLAS